MNVAVILAGGTGSRMGIIDMPKQFIEIYGKPVVIHTLESFDINENIDAICIVCLKEWQNDLKIWLKEYDIRKVRWITDAGQTRQLSSLNALNAISSDVSGDDIVVIHDAARPLVSQQIINENIEKAKQYGACDTVVPAFDTIITSTDGEHIETIPPRKQFYHGQTPQSFTYEVIRSSYDKYFALPEDQRPAMTDDCGLVLHNNIKIGLALGNRINMKLTTMEDLLLIKSIIRTTR